MPLQGVRVSELAVRHAEESLLDTEPAQLELQGLAGRLAAQQEHHNAVERGLEMQGTTLGSSPDVDGCPMAAVRSVNKLCIMCHFRNLQAYQQL